MYLICLKLKNFILQYEFKFIRDEALKSITNIAKYKPQIVLEITLPVFLDKLPCNEDEMKIYGIKANYLKILDALSELAVEPILFEAYVPQILKKFDFAFSNSCKLFAFYLSFFF